MKRATLGLLLLGVLAAGFIAGAWYNQRERVSAAALREDVDVHAHAGHAGADVVHPSINIDTERQQLIGVRVAAVEKRARTERLRLYGRVVPDETRVYTIDVGIDGFIRDVSRVTTGSHVRKDEWLATFSAPEARSAIQGYLVTLDVLERARTGGDSATAIDLATAGVQQSTDRLLTLGMSKEQMEEIARTRQVPANIRIAAPEDGFVLARTVSTGQKFERGDELYRIADLRRVWIVADVFGRDADYVNAGAGAEVFVAGRARPFPARVSPEVLPQFDSARQALQLRLEADNPGYLLRPDMFVDVDLLLRLPPAIVVPVDAVLDTGLARSVFVESRNGVFERREVETGWRFAQQVEIVKGLAAGDRIVVSGTFLVDSESRMQPANLRTDEPTNPR